MPAALVLLHGFTNTGASWGGVVTALGERYRPIAPDIRGHGSASEVRPVSLDGVVGDVAAVTSEAFTLVGYSMGGRIALHVALAHPDRVRRLVLIGASPGIADDAERAERRAADERLADELHGLAIEEFAARWARTPVLAGQSREVQAAVHRDRLRSTPAGLIAALRGLGTGALPPLWSRLAELAIPVELVAGERDAKFVGISEHMAAALRFGRVAVVPAAGHAVHLEDPRAVADIIARRHTR